MVDTFNDHIHKQKTRLGSKCQTKDIFWGFFVIVILKIQGQCKTPNTFMDPDGYLLNKQSVNQQNETNKNCYKKLLDQH